jgi:hypothetical protein
MLKMLERLLLPSKRLPISGEMVSLQTLDQFTHMDSPKEEPSQTDTLSTTIILRPPSRTLMMPLRLLETLLSTLKKLLMPGERDPLQTLDQSFLFTKTQLIMILMILHSRH